MTVWDVARIVVALVFGVLAYRQFDRGMQAAFASEEAFGDEYRALRRTYWRTGGATALWAGAGGAVGFNPAIGLGFAMLVGILLVGNAFHLTDFLQPAKRHDAKQSPGD